jgi:hypothetical protein
MENRAKTITKLLSGTQRYPTQTSPKRASSRQLAGVIVIACQHLQPKHSEQTTPTSPYMVIEPTHTIETVRRHMKIHAKTQPPAARQRSSDSDEKTTKENQARLVFYMLVLYIIGVYLNNFGNCI